MNETDRLLGELLGKVDLILDRLDKMNGRQERLEAWRAEHEALHAAGQGESRVRNRFWERAWQAVMVLLGPVCGAVAGWIVARGVSK